MKQPIIAILVTAVVLSPLYFVIIVVWCQSWHRRELRIEFLKNKPISSWDELVESVRGTSLALRSLSSSMYDSVEIFRDFQNSGGWIMQQKQPLGVEIPDPQLINPSYTGTHFIDALRYRIYQDNHSKVNSIYEEKLMDWIKEQYPDKSELFYVTVLNRIIERHRSNGVPFNVGIHFGTNVYYGSPDSINNVFNKYIDEEDDLTKCEECGSTNMDIGGVTGHMGLVEMDADWEICNNCGHQRHIIKMTHQSDSYIFSKFKEEPLKIKLFGCAIIKHNSKSMSSDRETLKEFKWFRFKLFMKYQWYFRYRTALYQVQYPTKYIELYVVEKYKTEEKKEQLKRLKNKVTAAKRKVTEYKNKLNKIVENHRELFPIENDERYKKTIQMIQEREERLETLQEQYNRISNG